MVVLQLFVLDISRANFYFKVIFFINGILQKIELGDWISQRTCSKIKSIGIRKWCFKSIYRVYNRRHAMFVEVWKRVS